ncbi:MAG: RNA polymerase sigma factor [Limisphaerales bacterium]
MNDDTRLREYAETGSPTAFRELVERHLPLVYSAARRRLPDPHLAEDVAQQVFVLLAHKAGRLTGRVVISGWLYRTACHLASETIRRETRRQRREQQAVEAMNPTDTPAVWRELEPLLDDAMAGLSEADRDAVVLRYFESKSLREVGAALGVSEDTAQKRLSRAVEKLRAFFARRGKALASGTLTAAISGGAIQSAPVGLAATVAATALSSSVVVTSTLATLMTWTTLKPALTTVTVLAAGTALVVQSSRLNSSHREQERLRAQVQTVEQSAADSNDKLRQSVLASENDPRNAEIVRLRGEVAALRRAETEFTAENAEMRQALMELVKAHEAARRQEDPEREAIKTLGIAKLNYSKQWGLALILAAHDHGGQIPASLAEAAKYFGQPAPLENSGSGSAVWDGGTQSLAVSTTVAGSNQVTVLAPDQFEIVFQGRLDQIESSAKTILLREIQPFATGPNGTGLSRTYLFADGHSEIHRAPDGDFTAWEAERMVGGQ